MPYKGFKSYKIAKTGKQAATKAAISAAKSARAAALSARRAAVVPGVTRTGGFYRKMSQGGQEFKFFDTSLAFTVDATGEVPATGQLSLIPQGDTESSRDGRKVNVTSILLKGRMTFTPAAAATASGVTYMYLVQDTQCNGAAAAATDVLTSTSFSVAIRNLGNSERFKILKKWTYDWNSMAGATTAYNNQNKHFEFYKKCNIPLIFSGTTGAITEIRSNNIFLLAGSTNSIDDLVDVQGVCRLRFTE